MIRNITDDLLARLPVLNRDGPLTQDLVLEPARFGLGHVPAKQSPDATTSMVCGFC